jgi:hypothetical protein
LDVSIIDEAAEYSDNKKADQVAIAKEIESKWDAFV